MIQRFLVLIALSLGACTVPTIGEAQGDDPAEEADAATARPKPREPTDGNLKLPKSDEQHR